MAGVFMCLSWEMKAVVKAIVDGFASPSQAQGEHISARHEWRDTPQRWPMPPLYIYRGRV